ncbi:MAG: hypothetical protein LQ349_002104 [Xanthoria aureola]|nr:MAG: hypothetical protein LQ349_002104 [Xanthoria aureola]
MLLPLPKSNKPRLPKGPISVLQHKKTVKMVRGRGGRCAWGGIRQKRYKTRDIPNSEDDKNNNDLLGWFKQPTSSDVGRYEIELGTPTTAGQKMLKKFDEAWELLRNNEETERVKETLKSHPLYVGTIFLQPCDACKKGHRKCDHKTPGPCGACLGTSWEKECFYPIMKAKVQAGSGLEDGAQAAPESLGGAVLGAAGNFANAGEGDGITTASAHERKRSRVEDAVEVPVVQKKRRTLVKGLSTRWKHNQN